MSHWFTPSPDGNPFKTLVPFKCIPWRTSMRRITRPGFFVDVENPLCFPRIVCKWMIFHWIVLFSHIYVYMCVCIYVLFLFTDWTIYLHSGSNMFQKCFHTFANISKVVGGLPMSFVPEDVHIAGPNPRPAAVSCRSSGKSIEKISLRTYFSGEFSRFIFIYMEIAILPLRRHPIMTFYQVGK